MPLCDAGGELARESDGAGPAGEEARQRAAAGAALAAAGGSLPAYPFRPIGYLQSCFTERYGWARPLAACHCPKHTRAALPPSA
jgi:hypothetical protein